jgi:hypothetical protein
MGRPNGRHNGEYSWQEADWAFAYSLICSGKTHNSIIDEAERGGLPRIADRTLMLYISLFRAKFGYPEPQKGMPVPWEGFNYDKTPFWSCDALAVAYQMFSEGRTGLDIVQEAVANGLTRISPLLFRKYLAYYCKETGKPYPRPSRNNIQI